jgi:hypothetical protein
VCFLWSSVSRAGGSGLSTAASNRAAGVAGTADGAAGTATERARSCTALT